MASKWEAFLDAPDEAVSGKTDWAAFLDAPEPGEDPNAPGLAESAARGAADVGTFGLAPAAYAAGGAGAYGLAKGVRSLLPGGVPEDAPSVGDVYEQLRSEYAGRDEASDPVAYGVGEGGAILAQIGPKTVAGGVKAAFTPGTYKTIGTGLKALPGLLSREGLTSLPGTARAAGVGAAKGSAAATAYGAADEAGHAIGEGDLESIGERVLERAPTDAAFGGALGTALGAGGKVAETLAGRQANRAAQLTDLTGKAKQVEKFDELADEFQQGAAERAADYEAGLAARRGKVAEQTTAQEAVQAKFEAETAARDVEIARRKAEAAAAAQAPTRDKAVLLAGFEGKAKRFGGEAGRRKAAEALYDEPFGESTLLKELTNREPTKALALATGLKDEAGAKIASVQADLSAAGGSVPADELVQKVLSEFEGELPTEARAKALDYVSGLLTEQVQSGAIPAASMAKLIKDMGDKAYRSPNLEAALGDSAKQVYRTVRRVLRGEERRLVEELLPEEKLGEFDTALQKYGLFKNAEMSANVKLGRESDMKPLVRYPKPAPIEEPPLPERPAKPYPIPDVAKPQSTPKPPPGLADMRAALEEEGSAGGLRSAARSAAGWIGGKFGGPVGRMAGRDLAQATAQRWLKTVAPSAAELDAKAGIAAARAARLGRWAESFEKAMAEGPRAVAVLHGVLMRTNPEYREAYGGEIQVTARAETSAPEPAAPETPVQPGPADLPDILATPQMDARVLELFQDRNLPRDREQGHLMYAPSEDGEHRFSTPFEGEADRVDMRWRPQDGVVATVHHHPKDRSGIAANRLNQRNTKPSKDDEQLLTRGKVPAYVMGTDKKVRVLERVGGQLRLREITVPDA